MTLQNRILSWICASQNEQKREVLPSCVRLTWAACQ